ncbi:tyrosine-type recombinase/integrase [Paenibacillus antibioticophila]|uniref:tyrosine-type recombinase/integrase n=1 Tax=Paenibacillus antibioticophila TaxID=1274374 RepID=UPI0005CA382A|nr:tyrosine-type recombinase/integrase [Paenibacillus antibioticophila]
MARRKKEELPPKVRKRGKGYTYRYDVTVVDEEGVPTRSQRDTKQYPTPMEAYNAGILIEAKLIEGTFVDEENILFIDWAKQAIEIYAAEKNLKPGTVEGKYAHLKQARKAFAGVKLKNITPLQVKNFFLSLRDEHDLGQSAINGIYATIRMIFRLAKRMQIIAKDPSEGSVRPGARQTFNDLEVLEASGAIPEYLEKEQVIELLKAIKQLAAQETRPRIAFGYRQLYRVVFLLTYTGLRIGELCALDDSRVDTKKKTIRVIANLYIPKGGIRKYELVTPKSDASVRTVDFSNAVTSIIESQRHDLKTFKLLCGEKFYSHPKRKFLFVSYKSFPGYPLNVAAVEHAFKRAMEAAKLPESITPHSMRHTFTSLNAEAGAPLEDIQKQLGHSSDEVTKRVYYHVTEARRRANVDKLDTLMQDLISTIN